MRLYFCMHIYMFDVFDRVVTVIYSVMRDYRKGNWTVSETMILIEAKKMDDERRLMKRISSSSSNNGDQNTHDQSSSRSGKPAELRWKWVEDYCWRKGCMRSQNQCNDKWDNLMRDYKKVRDYERKLVDEGSSYWNIEKNERKERNLPTNMLPQIYEALVEVVEKKAQQRVNVMALTATTTTTGGGGTTSSVIVVPSSSPSPNVLSYVHHHQLSLPTPIPSPLMPPPLMLQHHHISAPPSMAAAAAALPLPSPHIAAAPILPASQTQQPLSLPYSHPLPTMCDSSDSDTSEPSKSPAKRRRRGGGGGGGEGTSTGTASAATTTTASDDQQVGSAISRSASIIAEALEACEEREDRRHRDVLSLHDRKIKIEESKAEINRLGINGLVDAINNLANSIQALASQKNNNQSAPK
ncbi:uncharacterized protein LOC107418735 isoform X1 [Ziziphus jujuba]|uniref:Uncharacterized protein LOC107418735 isoform X1 n=1 Tax=Ziziphus jujuba TaxID=326968 RepID=A0A6P3ZTH1_ZIZJJ|nr:uncharacterized protein LOC107418735 isoform X1 [Ziziphus jujuba]